MYERKAPWYRKAKKEGYRSRAAYKLTEAAGAEAIVRPGDLVIDAGAAPGGWSQVLLEQKLADGFFLELAGNLAVYHQNLDPNNFTVVSIGRRESGSRGWTRREPLFRSGRSAQPSPPGLCRRVEAPDEPRFLSS